MKEEGLVSSASSSGGSGGVVGGNVNVNVVTTLRDLADYASVHETARHYQQKTIWDLTKARRIVQARQQRNIMMVTTHTILTASSIPLRCELKPTHTVHIIVRSPNDDDVEDDEIVLLCDEQDKGKMKKSITNATDDTSSTAPKFKLVDRTAAVSSVNVNNNHDDDDVEEMTDEKTSSELLLDSGMGLRKRKGGVASPVSKIGTATTSTASWKVEQQENQGANLATGNNKSKMDFSSSSTTKDDEADVLLQLFAATMPPKELRQAQKQAIEALQSYCHAATIAASILASLPPPPSLSSLHPEHQP